MKMMTGVLLLSALAANAASNTAVWCVGESTKVKPGDQPQSKNLIWDGKENTVAIGSARNEYTAFQIVARAATQALDKVTVEASDLQGPAGAVIPAADIDLFVEHYLNVRVSSRLGLDPKHHFRECTAGEQPTQMVPFNAKKFGSPFAVGPGRNQPVWVDIYVAEDAKPGLYEGVFKVKSGAAELAGIKVKLTVWNFTLPHETHFRTYLYTGPENLRWAHRLPADWNDPAWDAIYDTYFQMAHQHRLNFHPLGGSGLEEIGQRHYKYYDGSGFTRRVGKGAGQNVACIPYKAAGADSKRTELPSFQPRADPPSAETRKRNPAQFGGGRRLLYI